MKQIEFKTQLDREKKLQNLLYRRGYLLTNRDDLECAGYPFYGNWFKKKVNDKFNLYIHKEQHYYFAESKGILMLLIGHAYNPFNGKYDENDILSDLIYAYNDSKSKFFDSVSELTGIHLICVFSPEGVSFVQDCTAMKACYYGSINGNIYITSHIQMVRDIDVPKNNKYVKRLIKSRSYQKFGSHYLPGDLTVLDGFNRLGPNISLLLKDDTFSISRFYPISSHPEKNKYDTDVIAAIADLLKKSVNLTTKKWGHPAISLSGGLDSRTTCAAANGIYDKFYFYSFYCKPDEEKDANAAHDICTQLGIAHHIYQIPEKNSDFEHFQLMREIIARNSAYVSIPKNHEIRKYIYLSTLNDFDVELKSWASEIGRAYWEKRVGLDLSGELSPREFNIFQTRYIFNFLLMYRGDAAYRNFLEKTGALHPLFNYEHSDTFYWEYRFGSNGTIVTTGQDIFNFEVTMPMNNRRLMDMFLWFPHEMRKQDAIHKATISINEPKFKHISSDVHNGYFSSKRIRFEKTYIKAMTLFKKR